MLESCSLVPMFIVKRANLFLRLFLRLWTSFKGILRVYFGFPTFTVEHPFLWENGLKRNFFMAVSCVDNGHEGRM